VFSCCKGRRRCWICLGFFLCFFLVASKVGGVFIGFFVFSVFLLHKIRRFRKKLLLFFIPFFGVFSCSYGRRRHWNFFWFFLCLLFATIRIGGAIFVFGPFLMSFLATARGRGHFFFFLLICEFSYYSRSWRHKKFFWSFFVCVFFYYSRIRGAPNFLGVLKFFFIVTTRIRGGKIYIYVGLSIFFLEY